MPKGTALWSKWLRLRRTILKTMCTAWNAVQSSNSGKSMDEMLKAFVLKCYSTELEDKKKAATTATRVDGNDDSSSEDDGPADVAAADDGAAHDGTPREDEEVISVQSSADKSGSSKDKLKYLEKHVKMDPNWLPSSYLAFKMYGPPAAPNDSVIFRAELSNGPKAVVKSEYSSSLAVAGPSSSSSSLVITGGHKSRADLKNAELRAKEAEDLITRHDDFMRVQDRAMAMEVYWAEVARDQKKKTELLARIDIKTRLGRNAEAALLADEYDALCMQPEPQIPNFNDSAPSQPTAVKKQKLGFDTPA